MLSKFVRLSLQIIVLQTFCVLYGVLVSSIDIPSTVWDVSALDDSATHANTYGSMRLLVGVWAGRG